MPQVAELPELPHVLDDGTLRRHAQVELRTREGRRLHDDHGCRRRPGGFPAVHNYFRGRQQFVDGSIADRLTPVVPADHAVDDRLVEACPPGLTDWNAGL